jgi:hypothetical protein
MKWRKLGCVFSPRGEYPWMQSHASVPFAEQVAGNIYRVYFSSRNARGASNTGWVLVDITQPQRVLDLSPEPILAPGELGCFDDSGAMLTWITRRGSERFLYYIGWNLGITVPFRNSVGLAISKNFHSAFKRYAAGPILDRTAREPHFVGSCCVIIHRKKWRMWYLSCTGWSIVKHAPRHSYHIKYAESFDGIHWIREGKIAIDYADSSEYAISRPSVLMERGVWKMWYSYRGKRYRIGYAESHDGVSWVRLDQLAGIDVSETGWDAEMIEYPHVFDHDGQRYMLYNGNGYGKTGFGIAVLES